MTRRRALEKKAFSFDDVLDAIPEATGELLARVAAAARGQGETGSQTLYLVGGPVRDLLLGREIVDMDVMVANDALALARSAAADANDALRVTEHARFGTVRIESDEAGVDIARMRDERYAHPGALPEVSEGDLEQDVARRDFSVNALVCELDADHPTRPQPVVDLCGGLADLEVGRLRVLHPRSFHDDPTRAWRAARFAARFGFSLERRSRVALRDALRDGAFGAVSGERFRRELVLCFEDASRGVHPGRVLRLLADWHVLSALEPGLDLGKDRMGPLRRLGRTIASPEWATPRWRPWVAGLSIWLAPLPAALRRRTLERFSIRGEQASRIVRFGRDAERSLRALARARGRGAVDALLGDQPEETVQALHALADTAVRRRILRWGAEDRRRRAPVSGSDLTQAGLAGPEVGRALARIRAGFLDGEIANREEAIALAEELARRGPRRSRASAKRPRKAPAKARSADGGKGKSPKSGSKVAPRSAIADTPAD